MRPLYRESIDVQRVESGNAGLWYDKFCNLWPAQPEPTKPGLGTEKASWIKQVTVRPVGDAELLHDHYARRSQLVERSGGRLLCVRTTSRLVTGLGRAHPVENGFAWHPILGTPYLPGSSLKGLLRAWALTAQIEVDARLGTPGGRGDVMLLDALPLVPVQLELDVMTPHYGDYYGSDKPPGDWMSPTPVPFLVVAPGAAFHFALLPRGEQARVSLDELEQWLLGALGELGAGAKTAVGYGVFGAKETPPRVAERWLDARAREQRRLARMSESEALELARRLGKGDAVEGDPDLVRELLVARYHEHWSRGRARDKATTHGAAKLKQYAAFLQPLAPEAPAPEAPPGQSPADRPTDEEAALIEACRDDKARIKAIGEQLMQGQGPIASPAGRKAFLEAAKNKLARNNKAADEEWLKRLRKFMRTLA
jgi:CRISPR-associated protein Cmr6